VSYEFKVLTSKGESPGEAPRWRRLQTIDDYLARVLAPRPAVPAGPRPPSGGPVEPPPVPRVAPALSTAVPTLPDSLD